MCGIAGIVATDPNRPPPMEEVAGMLRLLAHRGPDGEGIAAGAGGVIGHRRLAILDLSEAARQPFPSEDGRVWSAVNGEIYNHAALRRELEGRGHRFRSATDSEVVVHLYEEHGPEAVARLDGMFALAVWDARRRRLLLARDRFGKKPLYLHESSAGIAFASEIAALLALAFVPSEPDPAALSHFLTFRFVPAPFTGFRALQKIPPAHWFAWEDGRSTLRRYWAPPEPLTEAAGPADESSAAASTGSPRPRSFDEAAGQLRERLREAVRRRLQSDVPLGLLLSGGLDSSAIAVEMARLCGGGFDTFSAGFAEEDYDESSLAARVASRLGSRHHEIRLQPDAASSLPGLVLRAGEPFADSSLVAVEALARAVRPHVTVALGGDGGDEVLGGYDRYRALVLAGLLGERPARLAARLTGSSADGFSFLPGGTAGRRNFAGRARRFLEALGSDPLGRNEAWLACFDEEAKRRLAGSSTREPGPAEDSLSLLRSCYPPSGTPLERAMHADLLRTLPDRMAFKLDTATMSVALEVRCPFLDTELVEWGARLPGRWKVSPMRGKRLLRRAYASELPAGVLKGRKAGFGLPVDRWLRGPLKDMATDLLLSPAASRELYTPRTVGPLLDEHLSGRRNHDDRLWAILCLELWHRTFVDRRPASVSAGAAAPVAAGAHPAPGREMNRG